MNARHHILDTGLNVVTEPRPGSGFVVMQLAVRRGALADAADRHGATHLMQECCLGGTATRSRDQIAADIEAQGGEISGQTGLSTVGFKVTALARHAAETFAVMADVVLNPVFDAGEVEKTKTIVRQWLKKEKESPSARAGLAFMAAAFRDQPAGRNVMGTAESLDRLTPEDLRHAHREMLADPRRMVVTIVGDMAEDAAVDLVRRHFGHLTAPATPVTALPPQVLTAGDLREETAHNQLNLIIGFPAPRRHDPDSDTASIFHEFLSGGMSAPLFQEIREKRGLVYSVYARYSAYDDTGIFSVHAGTGKGNAGELLRATFQLFHDLLAGDITDDDIRIAATRIISGRRGADETAANAAVRHTHHILEHGRLISLAEHEARLMRVTPDDVKRLLATFLRGGHYIFSGVGPMDTLPAADEIRALMAGALAGVDVPAGAVSPRPQGDFAATRADGPEAAPPQLTVLPNGLSVMTVTRPGTLACGAWVAVGADNEDLAVNGASHMNEHMMFKGTPSFAPGDIDEIVENELFADLNAYTSHDRTCYYFYNLQPSALDRVIHICGEMVFKAEISEAEFDGPEGGKGERHVVLEEILRAEDSLPSRQWRHLIETAYPGQPRGRPVLGYYDTIARITAADLRRYRDTYYSPNNTVFCAVGPVSHDAVVAAVQSRFGTLPAVMAPAPERPRYHGGYVVDQTDKAELVSLMLAVESPGAETADIDAWRALAAILGGGLSSRFEKEIVNRLQLTSGVATEIVDFCRAGLFIVMAKTEAAKAAALVAAIYDGIASVARDLDAAELDKVKAAMEMDVLREYEENSNACDSYACNYQACGRVVTPADLSADIKAVTVDAVKAAARVVLGSRPSVSVLLPAAVDPSDIPDEAAIAALRDSARTTYL